MEDIYLRWIPYMIIGYSNAGLLCLCFYLFIYKSKFVLDKLPYDVSFVDDD
jgi:hypothetical protein